MLGASENIYVSTFLLHTGSTPAYTRESEDSKSRDIKHQTRGWRSDHPCPKNGQRVCMMSCPQLNT